MRSASSSPHSERARSARGDTPKRWPALLIAFAAALVFGGVFAGRNRGVPEYRTAPGRIEVYVVDERGWGVGDARVELFHVRGSTHAMHGDTLLASGDTVSVRHDTLASSSDTLHVTTQVSGAKDGWTGFYPPERGDYRLILLPPAGWVVADSSTADTTVRVDSVSTYVRFILHRVP